MLKQKISEEVLHEHIAQYLCLVLPTGTIWTSVEVSNQQGGLKGRIKQIKLKKKGVRTGWPDVQIFYKEAGNLKALFLEIKVGKNKATDLQEECHNNLMTLDMPTKIVRSIDDVKDVLVEYGIIKKGVTCG